MTASGWSFLVGGTVGARGTKIGEFKLTILTKIMERGKNPVYRVILIYQFERQVPKETFSSFTRKAV